jgi:hypothetical protein
VALVRTDVSEECIAAIIRVQRIRALIPSILTMEEIRPSETSILTKVAWRHISEDGIIKRELLTD